MHFLTFNILFAVVAVIAAIPANDPQSLYDVDVQGHENIADRSARQYGYRDYGNYRGNYESFGGHRSDNYGGYRSSYGRYRDSNSERRVHFNNLGGYNVGYGSLGGNPGSYYG